MKVRYSLYDCDNDALLIGVEQLGDIATPVSAVVFINWMEKLHRRQPILCQLFGVIRDRRDHPVESSLYAAFSDNNFEKAGRGNSQVVMAYRMIRCDRG